MADDARRTKREAERMQAIHLGKAHPFVGIPRADFGPRQWLGDLGRNDLGSAHRAILARAEGVSSFRRHEAAGHNSHVELNRYFDDVEHWNQGEIERRADEPGAGHPRAQITQVEGRAGRSPPAAAARRCDPNVAGSEPLSAG